MAAMKVCDDTLSSQNETSDWKNILNVTET